MVMRARFHFEMQCIIAMKRIPLTLQEIGLDSARGFLLFVHNMVVAFLFFGYIVEGFVFP